MIYLVSDRIDVSSMNDVQKLSVEDSISLISSWPVVQFDTETTGLDPHVCSLASMQFGYHDFQTGKNTQIVVDCGSIDPLLYRRTIEASHLHGFLSIMRMAVCSCWMTSAGVTSSFPRP